MHWHMVQNVVKGVRDALAHRVSPHSSQLGGVRPAAHRVRHDRQQVLGAAATPDDEYRDATQGASSVKQA